MSWLSMKSETNPLHSKSLSSPGMIFTYIHNSEDEIMNQIEKVNNFHKTQTKETEFCGLFLSVVRVEQYLL